MSMTGTKKNFTLFLGAILALALSLGLTVWGFVAGGKTSAERLDADKTVAVRFDGGDRYVSTDDRRLLKFSEGQPVWEAELPDRTSSLVLTEGHVVCSYTSDRRIDVFAKTGERTVSLTVPYAVVGADADEENLYVAAKKGGLKGSVVYCFPGYLSGNSEARSASLGNLVLDIRMHPETGELFAAAQDYNIYRFRREGNLLTSSLFASVRFEPLGLGFAEDELVVADKTGRITLFSGGETASVTDTGLDSLCAFEVENQSGRAVACNISGKAAFLELNAGKLTKLSCPTEVQDIGLSPTGTAALSEYRTFRTMYADFSLLGRSAFLAWARYLFLALTLLSLPCAAAGWYGMDEGRAEKLARAKRRFRAGFRRCFKSYAFVLPTFVLLILFMYVPAVWGLFLSFFDYVPGIYTRPVGFENFLAAFRDPFFTGGIGNMLIFLVTDLFKALIPAVLIAELIFALNSKRSQYFMRVLLYIPGILPGVAVLLIWTKGIYGSMGLFNSVLTAFGGQARDWLGDPSTALASLVLIGLPWVGQYILFYGALMSIPESLRESARLDGCSWIKSVLYIDFPMIRPQLKYVFIITFINSIQDFGRIYLTTGQTPATNIPALQMYMLLNSGSNYGKAAAMGMLLFLVVFGATLFQLRAQRAENGM